MGGFRFGFLGTEAAELQLRPSEVVLLVRCEFVSHRLLSPFVRGDVDGLTGLICSSMTLRNVSAASVWLNDMHMHKCVAKFVAAAGNAPSRTTYSELALDDLMGPILPLAEELKMIESEQLLRLNAMQHRSLADYLTLARHASASPRAKE